MEVESPEELGYGNLKQNLAESSMRDTVLGSLGLDLNELVLLYGDHRGVPELRDWLAQDAGLKDGYQVLLTAGAAMALFLVATSFLEKEDHLVVVRPNYATNLETPRAIGCGIHFVVLLFERGFAVDPEEMAAAMLPQTKLLSVTTPHNPTGQLMTLDTLKALIALAEKKGVYLLVDETYREMTYGTALPVAASLSPRAISVCSLSKTYGMPGIRLGWVMCQDETVMTKLLAAKEQIVICGSVVDEAIAHEAMKQRADWLPRIRNDIAGRFEMVQNWMQGQRHFEWMPPQGGVVGLPRFCEGLEVDTDRFYKVLNEEYGTWVGPGHWFELSRRFFRLGFGWPTREELKTGLETLSLAAEKALK